MIDRERTKLESKGRGRQWALASVLLATLAACDAPSGEERARAAAEEIKQGVVDPGAAALDQKVEKEVIRQVQEALTGRKEYMGEVDGKLDSVTVNAIQAFQRSVNATVPWWKPWGKIPESGMLDEETLALMLGSKPRG